MATLQSVDPERVVVSEPVAGSEVPVELMYVPTMDGLYTPVGLRRPPGPGPFPVVLLAWGNGGGGMGWVRDAVRNRGLIMERLLGAGWACAWVRYRTEVDLGYHHGGRLVRGGRSGGELLNRSPLDHEDEIAVVEYLKALPGVDHARVALVGGSHGGEMVLKITSEYDGVAAAVAAEPAAHEFLALATDQTGAPSQPPGRDIDDLRLPDAAQVRARVDQRIAGERIAPIRTPILVLGRERDALQGVFRAAYELLAEAGKDVEWASYDHPDHGYVFPLRHDGGDYVVDAVRDAAIDRVLSYLAGHLDAPEHRGAP